MSDNSEAPAKPRSSFPSSGVAVVSSTTSIPVLLLPPRRVAGFFVVIVILVVFVGTVANYSIYQVVSSPETSFAKVLMRFDLGHEPSIPNFYSAVALLFSAVLLVLIGRLERQLSRPKAVYWFALATVFVGLGIDEAVLFHEMSNTAITQSWKTSGVLFLPWVIVGAIFAGAVAVLFLPFIYGKSKRTCGLFVLAGSIFVLGAIGMEMVASLIFDQAGSEELGVQQVSHTISQSIEEFCEMIGVVIFIYALIDYLAANFPIVEMRFVQQEPEIN